MYAKVNNWNAQFEVEVKHSSFVLSFHSRRQHTENPTASQISSSVSFLIVVACA